ncbi:hypothetical protein [Solibacillus sp. CAU 1738]|uniref:hypothetical protein n=1 Tax=Solibacillus sp. CAU 1738 TaxID=3140363 RepID=UPI00326088AE
MNIEEKVLQQVDEYDAKCPSCGASIKFNPANGMLTCPYCSYEEQIPQPELHTDAVAHELNFEDALKRNSFQWGSEKKTVICNACAAESIYDALEVANVCPYCGSNHVMESASEDSLAPNGVCPFEVTKTEADANFQKWIKGKWFAPNEAKRSAKADSFSGIYLPYWTFDTKTASQYTARYGKHRIVRDKDGNERTVTDWYRTSGFYQEFIDDHLVRATTRYDDNILRSIEPFSTNNPRAFNQDYLTGYIAERYSIGLEDGWKQAQREIHNYIHSCIELQVRRRHGADVVNNINFSTVHSNITYKYLMLPLWLSSFRFKKKTYQFMVNGQTGKVGGQSPISAIKVTVAVLIVLAVIAVLYFYNEGYIF